jgi:uncharacterized protein YbaP (TraB family)
LSDKIMRTVKYIKFSVVLVVCIINVAAFFTDAFSQNEKNFLWKAQSETNTVYILGSIHYMKKDMYPLDRRIEEAFERSDVLAVEANINDISQSDIQKFMESAFYKGDDSLEKHISGETYTLVQKEFHEAGMPAVFLNKQKPWFLALTLTSLKLIQLGFDPKYGLDVYFLSKSSGKKIIELESTDYQIKLLSGFSDTEQETFLLYTIKEVNSLKKDLSTLENAWKSGDADTMETLIMKSVGIDGDMARIYEKILYERNSRMAARIEDFLKSGDKYFVVIGAGHLIGKRGIIDILRRKGYRVEQL